MSAVFIFQIRNTRNVNRTGQLTGFKLVPGANCLPLAGTEAKFLRRAAFLRHNLWVTPYAHDEMYPGGEFPNQNPRVGEGLATWVNQNRSLEENDIVLWSVCSSFITFCCFIREIIFTLPVGYNFFFLSKLQDYNFY